MESQASSIGVLVKIDNSITSKFTVEYACCKILCVGPIKIQMNLDLAV